MCDGFQNLGSPVYEILGDMSVATNGENAAKFLHNTVQCILCLAFFYRVGKGRKGK